MKKILVPCDFSPQAISAFRVALDIASINMGEVYVFYVIESPLSYSAPDGMMPYNLDLSLHRELQGQGQVRFEKDEEFIRQPPGSCGFLCCLWRSCTFDQ